MGKFILVVIAIAVVVALIMRNRQAGDKANSKSGRSRNVAGKKIPIAGKSADEIQGSSNKPYSAVSIKTRLGACNAAIAAQDKIFLSTAAPSLPLAECDVEECACRYVYHDDRRQEDRRSPFGENHGAQHGGAEGNRREGEDRRKS